MILQRLIIENYGIYKDRHELEFETENPSKNITLIGGLNGRGKTSILEAVFLCLYGKRSVNFLETGLNYCDYLRKLINKTSAGYTNIQVVFNIQSSNESTQISVLRCWEDNDKKTTDTLEVYRNSVLDPYLTKNWDFYIEEILPLDIALLFFFDNEKISLLSGNETSLEIKHSIQTMLGINVVDKLITDVSRVIDSKHEHLEELTSNSEMESIRKNINQIDKELEKDTISISKLNTQKRQYQSKMEETESQFLKSGGMFIFNKDELNATKAKIEGDLSIRVADLLDIASSAAPLSLCLPLLNATYIEIKESEKIKAAIYAKEIMSRFIEDLPEMISDLDVTRETHNKLSKLLSKGLEKYTTINSNRPEYDISATGMASFHSLMAGTLKHVFEKALYLIDSINTLKEELNNINIHLSVDIDNSKNNKLLDEIKDYTKKISETEQKLIMEVQKKDLLELTREQHVGQLNSIIRKIGENKNLQDESARIVKYATYTIDVMKSFKQKLKEHKVKELSDTIYKYFSLLVGKNNFISRVHIDPGTLDINLYDYKDLPMHRSQMSAGERQMFAVSILWALTDCSGFKMPVLIDTPLGRLDSSHRSSFVSQYLPNASSQVIVLSTDEEIVGSYLESIENNISKKYMLVYNENTKSTTIHQGYFGSDLK